MAVPDDPNGVRVAVHRAVGKLALPHKRPTHTTDFVDLADAVAAGDALLEQGVWTEFYIKTVFRRRAVTRR